MLPPSKQPALRSPVCPSELGTAGSGVDNSAGASWCVGPYTPLAANPLRTEPGSLLKASLPQPRRPAESTQVSPRASSPTRCFGLIDGSWRRYTPRPPCQQTVCVIGARSGGGCGVEYATSRRGGRHLQWDATGLYFNARCWA